MLFTRSQKPKMIRPEEGSVFFFLITLAFLAVQFVASAVAMMMPAERDLSLFFTIASIFIHLVFIALYFLLIFRRRRILRYRVVRSHEGESRDGRVLRLAIICALGVIIGAVSFAAFHMPHFWFNTMLYDRVGFYRPTVNIDLSRATRIADSILVGIMVIIIAPISEELIFRGALLSGLSRITKPYIAVLLTALAFAVFHMSPLRTVYQLILGVVMGFAVIFTRKVIVAIIIHMVSNLFAFVIHTISLYSFINYYPYGSSFNIGYNQLVNFFSTGGGIGIAIAIMIGGAGIIVALMYLFKRITPKELELPTLDEPVKVSQNPNALMDIMASSIIGGGIFSKDGYINVNDPYNVGGTIVGGDPFGAPNNGVRGGQHNIDPFSDNGDPFSVGAGQFQNVQENTQTNTQDNTIANQNATHADPLSAMQASLEQITQKLEQDAVEDPQLTKLRAQARKKAAWRYFAIAIGVCSIMWLVLLIGVAAGCG